jgi:Flp pilus assembly protein TadD/outer membrane protein assembly factor BamB
VPRSVALVLLVATIGLAQDAPPPSETPRTAEIKALIERLGAADFKQREAAHEALLKIGQDAAPLLEAAAKDPDAERAEGAKEVLSLLRWRLPPTVEAALGKTLENYPSLPLEERKAGLDKVWQFLGSAKILAPFFSNVARFDPDPELRLEGLELYLALTPEGDAFRDALVLDALDREPPRDPLHFARARVLFRLGKLDEALREAEKAAQLEKPDPRAPIFVAEVLTEAGHPSEAAAFLDQLRAKNPQDLDVLVRLGEAYLLAGERQKGDEVLAEVMKAATTPQRGADKGILLRVAKAYMRVKRPDDARDAVQKAVSKAPYDADVNLTLAELDLALGRPTESLKRFLNEAKYFQKDPVRLKRVQEGLAQVFTALGYPELGQDDELLEDASRGRRLAMARELGARFLLGRGLVGEAVLQYRAACALDPDSVEVRVRLGDGLRRLGRDDDARKAYEQARALAPKDERTAERLKALALGIPMDGGRAPVLEKASDIEAWDHRVPQAELGREPEAAFPNALPPLVLGGRAFVLAPGTTTVYALDVASGALAWKASLERPAPPEGIAPDRVGLEPAGLLAVPSAACIRVSVKRARERTPLIALLVNEWVRAPGRTFKRASFEAALVAWFDPRDGKLIGTERLVDSPISSTFPPIGKGSRALVLLQQGEEKTELALLDLVASKVRWTQELTGGAAGRPGFAGDLAVASYASGVAVFDEEGALKLSALEGSAPSTGVTESEGALYFGTGRVVRSVPLAGTPRDLVSLPEGETAAGSVAVLGSRLFVASRGGAVRAFAREGGRELASQPLQGDDHAAARSLLALSGRLFALNGSEDSFRDETPALLALDPQDLSVIWRRPMDRPAAWSAGEGWVVAVSGGASATGGLRVVGARPGGAAADARPRFLQEVRAAAEDALADDQAEVAVLIARRWIALKGGLSLVSSDDLFFFARALARSRRPGDADSILEVARARGGPPDAETKIQALKKELGLLKDDAAPPAAEEKPK